MLRPPSHARATVAAALLVVACQQADPDPGTGPVISAEELFSIDHLPRFDLYLDDDAWAALEAEPKIYVPGRFVHADTTLEPIGIRLKGNHSFRSLDEKAAFKLKFNEYIPGQRFLELEGLTLNNMVVDSSMIREWIGYRVFREIGVPAPRAGFAVVYVNDEEYGLYVDIEPYNDTFLERAYDDPTGNLYESDKSADLDRDIWSWDQDEGDDLSREDLMLFSELAQQDGNAVFYGATGLVDMPLFLAFLAGEVIVGHFDGHMGRHNFFIYHEPTRDLWSYQPWSLDQALVRHVTPFEHEGYLGQKCLHDHDCLVDYVQAARAAVDEFETIDFAAEVAQVIELTDAAMRSDPRKPYSSESVESNRGKSLEWILGRAAELEPQLDCLVDGDEPDEDQDGYGPCFQDCDETDPAINPDAEELCDGIDNDCTGYIDDVPACPCPSLTSGGRTFYLCENAIDWREGRDFCMAQGHQLAMFDSREQFDEVWAAAAEIAGGRWSIGLSDLETENDYRWLDGSAPSFTAWAAGEPSHQLDWFDCVFVSGGVWQERNCIEEANFVCSD